MILITHRPRNIVIGVFIPDRIRMGIYFEFRDMFLPHTNPGFICEQRQCVIHVAPDEEFTLYFTCRGGRIRARKSNPALVYVNTVLVSHEFETIMRDRLSENQGVAGR